LVVSRRDIHFCDIICSNWDLGRFCGGYRATQPPFS
jgi:hypothetical protein